MWLFTMVSSFNLIKNKSLEPSCFTKYIEINSVCLCVFLQVLMFLDALSPFPFTVKFFDLQQTHILYPQHKGPQHQP